jgi:hypothetical protein
MVAGAMVVSAVVLAVMRAPAGGGRHYGVDRDTGGDRIRSGAPAAIGGRRVPTTASRGRW